MRLGQRSGGVRAATVAVLAVAGAFALAPTASGTVAGRVELPGGRTMFVECRGHGAPTVLLESGLRTSASAWSTPKDPMQTQPTVFPALARVTRVCAYDRPGTVIDAHRFSRSDPVRMPRSTGDLVADLRALVQAARIRGPYVLVGHSMGGLIVRQYTSLHPSQVAGLVLVDAIPETMETDLSVSDWNAYDALLLAPPPELADYPDLETVDFRRSFAQMRRAGIRPPRRIPYIVLSKGQSFGIPGRLGRLVDAAWLRGGRYLARLQPGTPHLIARNSGHNIQVDDPKLVIDSVQRVITAVHHGRASVG
jgi:pimeloyl-ACP methyl ester carboxylesterase